MSATLCKTHHVQESQNADLATLLVRHVIKASSCSERPSFLVLPRMTIVEVTLRTFARGNIDLLREILPEYTRGKFISGFIFPR